MSKRGPTSELNHDHWDKEDAEKERAGEFKQADTDEIKKRVILQAKRKTTSSSVTDVAKTPFGNFKGFSSTPANKPNFNFIVAPSDSKSPSVTSSNGTAQPKLVEKSSSEYFHQLKSCNVSVSAWIAKHIDSNPFCILTPVFKDYEKHLANIESKRLPPTPADAPNNLELETKTSPKTEEDVQVGSPSTNANLLDSNQRKSETKPAESANDEAEENEEPPKDEFQAGVQTNSANSSSVSMMTPETFGRALMATLIEPKSPTPEARGTRRPLVLPQSSSSSSSFISSADSHFLSGPEWEAALKEMVEESERRDRERSKRRVRRQLPQLTDSE